MAGGLRHCRPNRRRREDQRLLCRPRPATHAARARHRRGDPRRSAAGRDDAGGADEAVCGGVDDGCGVIRKRQQIAFHIAATFLFRFSARGHRSEIMFGVLIVVFRPDPIAGLGLSLG